MKKIFTRLFLLLIQQVVYGQQLYTDFEGERVISFGSWTGSLDSLFINPAVNDSNKSMHCARYIRSGSQYDNIQLLPFLKLTDVSAYASNLPESPKMTIKIYSTAPAGTEVHLQLGSRNYNTYPEGIHSEYIASTKRQNNWELLTFNYSQSTGSGFTSATEIDKIVLLFRPNSNLPDTFYFDDLTGPELVSPSGIEDGVTLHTIKLFQNSPNPAAEFTRINFQLNSPGSVSLQLYDLLGNEIFSLLQQSLASGCYSIPVNTENLPRGIYIYVLKKEGTSQAMKMTVSR